MLWRLRDRGKLCNFIWVRHNFDVFRVEVYQLEISIFDCTIFFFVLTPQILQFLELLSSQLTLQCSPENKLVVVECGSIILELASCKWMHF